MRFSIWNFRDWFEQRGIAQSYMITDGSVLISRLSSVETAEGEPCALVQPGSLQTDCSGFHTVLRVGNDRLLFPVAAPYEIYNEGNAMIECLTDWETQLLDEIAAGSAPQQLLDSAQTQLPFPLALLRRDGEVFCHSGDWQLALGKQKTQRLRQTLLQRPHAHRPSCDTLILDVPRTVFTAPLLSGGETIGFLFAYEGTVKFRPGDLYIFQALAELVQTALYCRAELPLSAHPAAGWFAQAIETHGAPAPLPALAGWESTDEYAVAVMPAGYRQSTASLQSLAAQLTNADRCCIVTADGLAVLLHARRPSSLRAAWEQLCAQRPLSGGPGVSLPFQDFSLLPYYYRQAVWAARHAQKQKLPAYRFVDSLCAHIVHACRSIENVQSFVHPDIFRIAKADPTSEEQLLRTLYTYLIFGRSISRASDALFMHRNTLRSKLKRIQSVCSDSWEDEDFWEQLLISLLLYPVPAAKSADTA